MKVMVRIPLRGDFTYEAPDDTMVGDEGTVSLWTPSLGPDARTYTGTVTSLESEYQGTCKPFVRTRRPVGEEDE